MDGPNAAMDFCMNAGTDVELDIVRFVSPIGSNIVSFWRARTINLWVVLIHRSSMCHPIKFDQIRTNSTKLSWRIDSLSAFESVMTVIQEILRICIFISPRASVLMRLSRPSCNPWICNDSSDPSTCSLGEKHLCSGFEKLQHNVIQCHSGVPRRERRARCALFSNSDYNL